MAASSSVGAARRRLMTSVAARALAVVPTAIGLGVSLAGPAHAGTVNPVQTTTYNLTPANNPITFGPSTSITVSSGSPSVYGANGTSWNVTNQGNLSSTTAFGSGVYLKSISDFANSGNVSGHQFGVELSAGGNVTNAVGGNISGYAIGVAISDSGNLTNSGTISSFHLGVSMFQGTLTNNAGGVIIGSQGGVAVGSAAVINSGNISSLGGPGVQLGTNGSLVNDAGGVIRGGNYAVFGGPSASATNYGVIHGQSYGVQFRRGGSFSNSGGGTVYGFAAGFAGVLESGNYVNTVTNGAGSTISGSRFGVYIGNNAPLGAIPTVTSTVTNSGNISGATGVSLDRGTLDNLTGGTIAGVQTGVSLTTSAATITNAGTVTGGYRGVTVLEGGTVTNSAGGVIQGGATSEYQTGVYIKGGVGSVTNAGNISGGSGVALRDGGSVTNSGNITSTGTNGFGVVITNAPGTVNNYGAIHSATKCCLAAAW